MLSDLSFDDLNIFGNMILLSIEGGLFGPLFLNILGPIFEDYVVLLIDNFVYLDNNLFLLFNKAI
jgi:hypothetical protein